MIKSKTCFQNVLLWWYRHEYEYFYSLVAWTLHQVFFEVSFAIFFSPIILKPTSLEKLSRSSFAQVKFLIFKEFFSIRKNSWVVYNHIKLEMTTLLESRSQKNIIFYASGHEKLSKRWITNKKLKTVDILKRNDTNLYPTWLYLALKSINEIKNLE